MQRRGRPDGFRPPPNPIMEALDTNGDNELSAEEINGAVAALRSVRPETKMATSHWKNYDHAIPGW